MPFPAVGNIIHSRLVALHSTLSVSHLDLFHHFRNLRHIVSTCPVPVEPLGTSQMSAMACTKEDSDSSSISSSWKRFLEAQPAVAKISTHTLAPSTGKSASYTLRQARSPASGYGSHVCRPPSSLPIQSPVVDLACGQDPLVPSVPSKIRTIFQESSSQVANSEFLLGKEEAK